MHYVSQNHVFLTMLMCHVHVYFVPLTIFSIQMGLQREIPQFIVLLTIKIRGQNFKTRSKLCSISLAFTESLIKACASLGCKKSSVSDFLVAVIVTQNFCVLYISNKCVHRTLIFFTLGRKGKRLRKM